MQPIDLTIDSLSEVRSCCALEVLFDLLNICKSFLITILLIIFPFITSDASYTTLPLELLNALGFENNKAFLEANLRDGFSPATLASQLANMFTKPLLSTHLFSLMSKMAVKDIYKPP